MHCKFKQIALFFVFLLLSDSLSFANPILDYAYVYSGVTPNNNYYNINYAIAGDPSGGILAVMGSYAYSSVNPLIGYGFGSGTNTFFLPTSIGSNLNNRNARIDIFSPSLGGYAGSLLTGGVPSANFWEIDPYDGKFDSVGDFVDVGNFVGFILGNQVNMNHLGGTPIFLSNNGINPLSMYVRKTATLNGTVAWAFSIPNATMRTIAIDAANDDIVIGGEYTGTVDFDPSVNTANMTSTGYSGFIARYSSLGSFQWVQNISSVGGIVSTSQLAIQNGLIVAGITAQVNATGAIFGNLGAVLGHPATPVTNDIYIARLDSLGNFLAVDNLGGIGNDVVNSVIFDNSGNIVVGGNFSNSIDLDPSLGISTLSAGPSPYFYMGFIASFSPTLPNSTINWVRSPSGSSNTGAATVNRLSVGLCGGIIVAGDWFGTIPAWGASTVFNQDLYVNKYDAQTGATIWIQPIATPNNTFMGDLEAFPTAGYFAFTFHGNLINPAFFDRGLVKETDSCP